LLAHFAVISHLVDAEYDPLVPDLKRKLIHPKSIRGWTFIGDSPWPLKEPCFRKLELNAIQFVTDTVQSEIRKKAVVLFEDAFELLLAICGIQFGCASFRARAFSQKWVDLNHCARDQTVRVTEENWNEAFLLSIRREAMY
jgi:hypothetical protein